MTINFNKREVGTKMTNVADEIKKLKELLDDGTITQEEFEKQKQILLNSTPPIITPVQNVTPVKKKNKGCLIATIIILLFIVGLIFGISQIIQNSEKYNSTFNPNNMILNVSNFSRISINELISTMGKADRIEDWENKTSKGNFPLKIYTYGKEDYYLEFISYNDVVVKLRCFSNTTWSYKGKNKKDILSMFGVTFGKNAKITVNNGATYKISPVSDKVAKFEVYNLDKNNTFNIVYVTYDLNYFEE